KVIHNGFSQKDFSFSKEEKEETRKILEKHKIPKTPFILSLGRLEARKNQGILVQAFADFVKKFPEYHLVLAGPEGFGFKEIKRLIKEHRLSHKVHLPGYIPNEEIKFLLKSAHLFAFPSLAESFGFPVLEAFATHTPVIASNALEEITGIGAYLVDPLNVEEWFNALVHVAMDYQLRQDLVRRGLEQLENFSWEKCIDETWELLASV
ncbi:MAG TPA: glycosyltransferase family 1 protein, partial [Candidatus Peregrinibacteria bacterium]|nr:glycosyltransferase family 1 protein [Candidatus Peregrinibacteria bacterium]